MQRRNALKAKQVTERLFALQDAVSGSRDERAPVKQVQALESENADLQSSHRGLRERIIALEEQRDRQLAELQRLNSPVMITPTSLRPISLSVGQRQEVEQMIKFTRTWRDERIERLLKRVEKLERRDQTRELRRRPKHDF